MEEEREPIGSNIHDAINFMTKELERRKAVIDASVWHLFKGWSLGQLWAAVWVITLFVVFTYYHSVDGLDAIGAFLFPFFIPLGCTFFCLFFNSDHLRARDTLVSLLPDLQKLYEYDHNMDIGFQLNSRGWFDETVLKAMMQRREREIRQQSRS